MPMLIPTERAVAEIEVKKSRFIAIAIPTDTMEAVKEAVLSVRREHPDATHVVHASVIGKAGTMYSSSDDREPKNTAGRPALEVLKGSGVTDVTVAVVRYFGGTLLGTGGLVKAYGDSVKEVLKVLRTEPLIEKASFRIVMPYNACTLMKRLFSSLEASIEREDFALLLIGERIVFLKHSHHELLGDLCLVLLIDSEGIGLEGFIGNGSCLLSD